MVYELNDWHHNPANTCTLKNCLFSTVKLTKNAEKTNFTYNGRRITFDGNDMWSYGNDFARNLIFGVDNFSSSHTSNKKNF